MIYVVGSRFGLDDLFRVDVRVLDHIAGAAFPGERRNIHLVALCDVSLLGEAIVSFCCAGIDRDVGDFCGVAAYDAFGGDL